MKITKRQLRKIIYEVVSSSSANVQIPNDQLSNPDFINTGLFALTLAGDLNSKGYKLKLDRSYPSSHPRLLQSFVIPGAHVFIALGVYYNGKINIEAYMPYENSSRNLRARKEIKWSGNNQEVLKQMVEEAPVMIQQILDTVENEKRSENNSNAADTSMTWSVVVPDEDHGYVTEIEYYESKERATAAAKDMGGAYVLKGTQMWNEPLGQVEEDNIRNKPFWVSGEL